ncbi:MAG: CBS domain-containing protein [Anaerolineales bacterium]|nr:CBS domain-containing protein [Anaerolineales bacterium]
MLLILTHEKADFDAIASQLGAYKLFPDGVPLLPRYLNRNVQQFLNLYWDVLPFMRPDDWRRRRVDEVILVDTQNLNSVRGMARNPQVRVIDHHVDHEPRPDWTYQVEAVGATTTLLVEMLQANGLLLTPEEATLLLLGVYEDTGSLTYDTATARDVRAAAWLFEQGAQLDVVRRFLTIPLTSEQQALYAELQANANWSTVQGRAIVVTTAVAPQGFNDEISSIAHRLRETLTPAGLFVLVQLGHDVQLVARSSHASVDVSLVAKALGGGGHSRAAAALIVGATAAAVAQKVTALLPKAVKPLVRVAAIMSYGVQTITSAQTIAEAAHQMRRTGHEGYPVVDQENGRIQGLLTRNAVDRAMSHEMGQLPVNRIMKMGAITVRPSESIERVQELMLREGWGQIPVVADMGGAEGIDTNPIGIVTRTDLLNYWFQPVTETAESDMRALLAASLQPEMWALVQAVSAAAAELQMPLYFVGGLVRDILLGKSSIDLDMVVEGDAILLVRNLQTRLGGDVHTHSRFGTGKWFVTPEIWAAVFAQYRGDHPYPKSTQSKNNYVQPLPASIDFVTARSEFYAAPSALPEVERGSIKLDLHRRDFTINTLAVRLDGAHLGELLDFYGGQRDLEHGLIRVLHSLSFIDDPTRVLRAIRLEQRLGFMIETRTAELLDNALPMLKRVTGDRIRHEIELALREADPILVMERFAGLGVMKQIYPGLIWTPEMAAAFKRVPQLLADPIWHKALPPESKEFLFFALWLTSLPQAVQEGTVERLKGRKSTRDDVLAVADLLHLLQTVTSDIQPSVVTKMLRPFPARVLLAARIIVAENPFKAQLLDKYYSEWRHVKTSLSGADLRLMGLKPGPTYSIWLERLLAARLNGEINDETGERLLLAELIQESGAQR